MASFITANEVLTQRQNGSISRCGGHGDPKIIGRLLDEAAGVDAGRVVAPSGTTNLECQEPTTEALVKAAYGFTVFSPMQEDSDLTDGTPHYGDNSMVSIMTKGSMYVDCEGTVVAGGPVFVRVTSDAGDNTELGKVRGDSDVVSGGVVLTPGASLDAEATVFTVTLSNGTVTETFSFLSDATPTAADVSAGLVAEIDASANFAATGTVTISITSGTGIVEVVELNEQIAITTPARAFRLPGAYFTESRTGAGLVEIHFDRAGAI
jgi:hypothetical protein